MPRAGHIRAGCLRKTLYGTVSGDTGCLAPLQAVASRFSQHVATLSIAHGLPNERTPRFSVCERRSVITWWGWASGRWASRWSLSIIREAAYTAEVAREAYSLLFLLVRLSLSFASSPCDGRFPWVARRDTNIGCPRDRALSRSRSAIPRGGSVGELKLTNGAGFQRREIGLRSPSIPTSHG
jgi:hypothetical protein